MVQVLQLDESNDTVCSYGSGSLVDAEGTILTNFHVVRSDGECQFAKLGIALTTSADEEPDLKYLADVHVFDAGLDLAVLKVSSTTGGGEVNRKFPFLRKGDSDKVSLGDEVDILGYPAIGGQTLTYTEGRISGFTKAPDVDGRAWLKTDGAISGGNSGGAAVDSRGRLIGIPTLATGNPGSSQVTDCRRLQDTNGDGEVNESDSCIPIGGFLNSLRPVALADRLLKEAETADPIPLEDVTPEVDPADVNARVGGIQFAADVDDQDQPVGKASFLPSGANRICAFFGFSGLADGIPWQALWSRDGSVDEQASLPSLTWNQGDQGTTWVCSVPPESGALLDGLWELSIFVNDGEDASSRSSLYIGDDHAPATVTFVNRADKAICRLLTSPDLANTYTGEALGGEKLLPDYEIEATLPAGQYDVLAKDCNDETVADVRSLEVTEGATLEVTS